PQIGREIEQAERRIGLHDLLLFLIFPEKVAVRQQNVGHRQFHSLLKSGGARWPLRRTTTVGRWLRCSLSSAPNSRHSSLRRSSRARVSASVEQAASRWWISRS